MAITSARERASSTRVPLTSGDNKNWTGLEATLSYNPAIVGGKYAFWGPNCEFELTDRTGKYTIWGSNCEFKLTDTIEELLIPTLREMSISWKLHQNTQRSTIKKRQARPVMIDDFRLISWTLEHNRVTITFKITSRSSRKSKTESIFARSMGKRQNEGAELNSLIEESSRISTIVTSLILFINSLHFSAHQPN